MTRAGTVGVLLAAGRGRRMATLKQLLPWQVGSDARPLVAVAFDALASACDSMIVVVGVSDQKAVVAALGGRGFTIATVESDREMFESVKAGLHLALQLRDASEILLHPADHPIVHLATVNALRAAARESPEVAIMPEVEAKGGHPVLIPIALVERIIAWRGTGGLRAFWEEHPSLCRRIATDDKTVVFDIDTPDDYARLKSSQTHSP
jgi:CTP:molybdopterin cytidylyltransferase MocA